MASRNAGGEANDQTTYDCIYCLGRLDAQQFNREHVLSAAFGAFIQAPMLHYCVCREFNRFFGNQLELPFARGAFEGMLRYQSGVRTPPNGVINLRYVDLAIPEGKDDWSGARLKLMNGEDGLCVSPIAQAAFFDQIQERWVHAVAEEIGELLTKQAEFKKGQIKIYAPSLPEYNAVVSKLSDHDVNFQKDRELQPPRDLLGAPGMEVEVMSNVNQGIRRCVAKYAFNYLALMCGSEFVRGARLRCSPPVYPPWWSVAVSSGCRKVLADTVRRSAIGAPDRRAPAHSELDRVTQRPRRRSQRHLSRFALPSVQRWDLEANPECYSLRPRK